MFDHAAADLIQSVLLNCWRAKFYGAIGKRFNFPNEKRFPMKKLAVLCTLLSSLSLVAISGCESRTEVIEVPANTPAQDASMEGMTEEEYSKEMEESMK